MDTYLRCGEQFRRIYVLGQRRAPGVALVDGSSHHTAMEANNLEVKEKDRLMSPRDLVEVYVEDFRRRIKEAEKVLDGMKMKLDWEGEKEEDFIGRAKVFEPEYLRKLAPSFKPVESVEDKFEREAEVDGTKFKVRGKIDLVTASEVADYKITNKAKSDREVYNSLQLSLYSWAAQKTRVGYVTFVKTKSPYVAWIPGERDPGRWAYALRIAASVMKAVRAKSFPLARPDEWWCSPKFCGFFLSGCRGKWEKPFIKEEKSDAS